MYLFFHVKVFQGFTLHFSEIREKAQIPNTNQFPPARFVFIHISSCLFSSVVFNCFVHLKLAGSRFVSNHSFHHPQLLILLIEDQGSLSFVGLTVKFFKA